MREAEVAAQERAMPREFETLIVECRLLSPAAYAS